MKRSMRGFCAFFFALLLIGVGFSAMKANPIPGNCNDVHIVWAVDVDVGDVEISNVIELNCPVLFHYDLTKRPLNILYSGMRDQQVIGQELQTIIIGTLYPISLHSNCLTHIVRQQESIKPVLTVEVVSRSGLITFVDFSTDIN